MLGLLVLGSSDTARVGDDVVVGVGVMIIEVVWE